MRICMQQALMTLVGEICISGTIKNCLNISVFSTKYLPNTTQVFTILSTSWVKLNVVGYFG